MSLVKWLFFVLEYLPVTLKIIFFWSTFAVYGYMSTIYKQYITQSVDLVSRRVMFPVAMQSFLAGFRHMITLQ